jgi:nitrous oxide reductase accessory protein NosL
MTNAPLSCCSRVRHELPRRDFLRHAGIGAFLLTPLAALLAACGKNEGWPEGMAVIHWDRDTCAACGMVISDRRFAVEARNSTREAYKFDDIGCFIAWQERVMGEHPWLATAQAKLWVADAASVTSGGQPARWLDPRAARYIRQSSPMGYNLAAIPPGQAGNDAMDFEEMRRHVKARIANGMRETYAGHDGDGAHDTHDTHGAQDARHEGM